MATNALFLLACAIFLIAFFIYNKDFIFGKFTPPFAAWALFTAITAVNCLTYHFLKSNYVTIALFLTDFLVCLGTSTVILVRNKGHVSIDFWDKVTAILSVAAIGVWLIFRTVAGGNLMNLIPYSLAWLPIYRNWRKEPPLPWLLDSVAFILNIVALWLQPDTRPVDYVSPAVCLFHHSLITALSYYSRRSAVIVRETSHV